MPGFARMVHILLMACSVVALALPWDVPTAYATAVPAVTVSPTSAAPGESVTLSGTGFPPGSQVVARIYLSPQPLSPGADLGAAAQIDAAGAFTTRGTILLTLFGQGSRASLSVIPGTYTIIANAGPGITASTPFTVGAPEHAGLLWGEVAIDTGGGGVRGTSEPLATGAELIVQGPGQPNTRRVRTDALGRYVLAPLPGGATTVSTTVTYRSTTWSASATASVQVGRVTRIDLLLRPGKVNTPLPLPPTPTTPDVGPPSAAQPLARAVARPNVIIPSGLPATGRGGVARSCAIPG